MKSKKIKTAVFVCICILAFFILFISASADNKKDAKSPENTKPTYYTVAEYQGKIAVFKNSDDIPFEIYDSYVESLPEHDREILKKGIKAENAQELQKIIEDYTS